MPVAMLRKREGRVPICLSLDSCWDVFSIDRVKNRTLFRSELYKKTRVEANFGKCKQVFHEIASETCIYSINDLISMFENEATSSDNF